MITWTFKSISAGLALLLALSGCAQIEVPLPNTPTPARKTATQTPSSVVLGGGRIALKPPAGYCIDRDTLDTSGRDGFAMLARCDLVGDKKQAGLAALRAPALITVTTRPWSEGAKAVTAADLAKAYPAETILEQRNGPPVSLIRASGGAPDLDGIDDIHWRGALVVNGQLVTLGLFAPSGNAILGAGGGTFLAQMARRIARDSRGLPVGN